jgi:hypothetical protein
MLKSFEVITLLQDHCTIGYCDLVCFNFEYLHGTWPHVVLQYWFNASELPRLLVGLFSLHHQLLL